MKTRATASETVRFIITTAAKSTRFTFDASSRKNITTRAPTVVNVAARSDTPTFLFLWYLIWSVITIVLFMMMPNETVMPARE
jgi:hypothetical protein